MDGNVTLDKQGREMALLWSKQHLPSTLHHHLSAHIWAAFPSLPSPQILLPPHLAREQEA